MKKDIRKLLFPILLPFLLGAINDETVHSSTDNEYVLVTDSNASKIASTYGYFEERDFPILTEGKENAWKLNCRFVRKTSRKIQVRLYYVYGNQAAFKAGDVGCKYYEVYRSGYISGSIGSYFNCNISLKSALADHGISTDYRYKIFKANFALGIYVDEHPTTYKGEVFYMYIPSTFNSGNRYHLEIGKYVASTYVLRNTTYNEEEYHRKVRYGGEDWKAKADSVLGGKFHDWNDFSKESRGEIDGLSFKIPLKMSLTQFGNANNRDLIINDEDMNLFIYDGYERYNLGEPTIGYDGKKGYKIPLRRSFDGTYITFYPKKQFYMSSDGRKVYDSMTVPNGGRGNYYQVYNEVPLPAIEENIPTKFVFQIELLNSGPIGLVDITAKFSYTKSKNYFGSHKSASYYVEEEL